MHKVVSVSIGSSKRNHKAVATFLGEEFQLERIGTDGDVKKAVQMMKELDGTVDAIGVGGTDLYLWIGKRRYTIRDSKVFLKAVHKSFLTDGSGLKHTLEKKAVQYLLKEGIFKPYYKYLVVSAVDRWGMAEAIYHIGGEVVYGDIIFALGLDIPVKTLRGLFNIGIVALPIAVNLPFSMLYPTGKKQEIYGSGANKMTRKYFQWADVIAGDFLYIKKYMPERLDGKIIFTNTTTAEDAEEVKRRGAKMLITTTPVLDGRSFGTNVMEGVFATLLGYKPEGPDFSPYEELIDKMGIKPTVRVWEEGEVSAR